jgi:hypothetical protein
MTGHSACEVRAQVIGLCHGQHAKQDDARIPVAAEGAGEMQRLHRPRVI